MATLVPAPGAAVMGPDSIPTTTVQQPSDVSKLISQPGSASLNELAAAQAAQQSATAAPLPGAPTGEDFDATLAQERANLSGDPQDAALARAKVGQLPDPFEPQSLFPEGDQKPITQAEAQDKANAFKTEALAKQQALFMQQQQEALADLQKRRAQVAQDIAAKADEYRKAANPTSFYEDKGTFGRIMMALAEGMGAYGAGQTGGPNHAHNVIMAELNNDTEMKRAKMQAALELYKMAGAQPEQLQQYWENAQKNLLASNQAKIDAIDLAQKNVLARYPQAQQGAKELVANLRAKQAQDMAALVIPNTEVTHEGQRVTNVTGKAPQAAGNADTRAGEGMRQAGLGQALKQIDRLIETGGLTDEERVAQKNAQNRVHVGEREGQESYGGAAKTAILKKVGVVPESSLAALPEKSRETALAESRVAGAMADAYGRGNVDPEQRQKLIEQFTPPPGLTVKQRQDFYKGKKEQVQAALATAPKAEARMESAIGAPAAPHLLTSKEQDLLGWANAHPGNPKATAIKKKIVADKIEATKGMRAPNVSD